MFVRSTRCKLEVRTASHRCIGLRHAAPCLQQLELVRRGPRADSQHRSRFRRIADLRHVEPPLRSIRWAVGQDAGRYGGEELDRQPELATRLDQKRALALLPGCSGLAMMATRRSFGTISHSNSSRLPLNFANMKFKPVMFAFGCDKLSANPEATGSPLLM